MMNKIKKQIINKNGFTLIDTMISIIIISFFVIVCIGLYSNYQESITDISYNIQSKINYTESISKKRALLTNITIDNKTDINNKIYIDFFDKYMTILEDNKNNNYSSKNVNYSKAINSKISITTNITNNILYFNNNGFPVDINGNILDNIQIYVTKNGDNINTITIDSNGKTNVFNGKLNTKINTIEINKYDD